VYGLDTFSPGAFEMTGIKHWHYSCKYIFRGTNVLKDAINKGVTAFFEKREPNFIGKQVEMR
jgi:hypothetical protein